MKYDKFSIKASYEKMAKYRGVKILWKDALDIEYHREMTEMRKFFSDTGKQYDSNASWMEVIDLDATTKIIKWTKGHED